MLAGMSDTAEADGAPGTAVVLTVTGAARSTVVGIRDQEEDAELLGLRVEVTGSAGLDYSYDLCLDAVSEAADDDHLHTADGLTVIIPADSVEKLRGATLDLSPVSGNGGLVIRNANRPSPLGDMGRLNLTGDIADRVGQLLESRINPALASHGGFARLVEVRDDDSVVVTMGGGCQGCSMSQLTLSDGIRQAIREAVPEVTDVVDATDHTAGANPYYS